MSVLIDVTDAGLVLEVSGGTSASEVRNRLQRIVPRSSILSYRGRFIVPEHLSYLVLADFTGRSVTWTRSARTLASQKHCEVRQLESARAQVAFAVSNPEETLRGYELGNKLDPHQLQAVAAITAPSVTGLALFDEQGLGKTISALCSFDRLRELNKVDRLVVVAPKSVLPAWENDARHMFEDRYKVTVASGAMLVRRRCIREEFDILVCNYECLIAELQLLIRTISGKNARVLLIVDESYFVKNSDARRSKAVAALRPHCSRVVILCGTPAPNCEDDLMHQLHLVSTGCVELGDFSAARGLDSKGNARKALSDILYLRRLKKDVLPEIPEKRFEKIFVNLRPVQRSLYAKARDELIVEVRRLNERTFRKHLGNFLARRSTLLQLCSHPGGLDSTYIEVPGKLLALDQILREVIEQKESKAVIWSFYRYSLAAIADRYRRYGVVRIDGSVTKVEDRSEAVKRFQTDRRVRLFVGNAAAAGAGITLTAAHHAIYESLSDQAAHYMQSVDRIHRRGQQFVTTYHVLIATGTIEESQFGRLIRKEQEGHDLLGDRREPVMTRERFLRELGDPD